MISPYGPTKITIIKELLILIPYSLILAYV